VGTVLKFNIYRISRLVQDLYANELLWQHE
jgi:hypothetical protein